MTWPKEYGGGVAATQLERYVVTEEMLAHRAPTRHYSTADRQSGPGAGLRYMARRQVRKDIVPRIVLGRAVPSGIGSSEPTLVSTCSAASTRATKTDGGWLVNGRKDLDASNAAPVADLLYDRPPAHLE